MGKLGSGWVETCVNVLPCLPNRAAQARPHHLNTDCIWLLFLNCPALLCLNPQPHLQEILNGGVDICREAGIPLAGGHSIDSPEPIFGLVVTGVVDPQLVKRNSAAQVRIGVCLRPTALHTKQQLDPRFCWLGRETARAVSQASYCHHKFASRC